MLSFCLSFPLKFVNNVKDNTMVCNILKFSLHSRNVQLYDICAIAMYVISILACTWFTFGLPSKVGCDKGPR